MNLVGHDVVGIVDGGRLVYEVLEAACDRALLDHMHKRVVQVANMIEELVLEF